MSRLFVVNNPRNWPLHIPGVEVVSARAYLTDHEYSDIDNAKVFNLCRSYRYMSNGYYVSLLAEARGHRAIPSIMTLQDMRSDAIFRIRSEDLDGLIQKSRFCARRSVSLSTGTEAHDQSSAVIDTSRVIVVPSKSSR